MEEKTPIDRKRESAGYVDIGSLEDGAIIEIKEIGGRILAIKEHSIYELIFADKIDPERTNISLPSTIQKLIIDKGAESEIMGRTFLTAKTIFKSEYLNENVDCNYVLGLTIDLLSELSILEKEINDYYQEENISILNYEKRMSEKGSFQIPSIANLETRCKTIFQKVDQIKQTLIEIIYHFYPNRGMNKQSHFPKFYEILKETYGEKDSFTEFIGHTLDFIRVMRELRNALDHRLSTYKITDFELKSDGIIHSPTIELNQKDVKLEKTNLKDFLNLTIQNMIDIIEVSFAFLAARAVKTSKMQYRIMEIPVDKRRYKFVKFSFWIPLGNEGFYCQ